MNDTIPLSGLPRFRCSELDNRVIKLYQNMSHLPLLLRGKKKKRKKTSRMLAVFFPFPPDVARSVFERKIITSDCVIGYMARRVAKSFLHPRRFSNAKPHEAFISAKLFTLPQPFLLSKLDYRFGRKFSPEVSSSKLSQHINKPRGGR
jgi:hypothetical protein